MAYSYTAGDQLSFNFDNKEPTLMIDRGYPQAALDKYATDMYSGSRAKHLEQQIEAMEARLKEMKRAKELLDKHPDIEELVSILARI